MRPSGGYFFEDYAIGQSFDHAVPRTITAGDTALYQALNGSRNPLHCSEPFAQSLGYPTTPVDDLLVFHIAFGKTVPDISYNAVANLGYAQCRFVKPVFVGDTLTARTEVLGLKGNSNGKTGVVYVRSTAFNQHDQAVLTWVRWVMVHRRSAIAAGEQPAQGQTAFAESVSPDHIATLPVTRVVPEAITRATGCGLFWDDINIDAPQTIQHPAGLTIDESDHTLATKALPEHCASAFRRPAHEGLALRPAAHLWRAHHFDLPVVVVRWHGKRLSTARHQRRIAYESDAGWGHNLCHAHAHRQVAAR